MSGELDSVFQRSEDLSYENRRGALLEEGDGEVAAVVDPIESPLWYVSGGDQQLEDLRDPQKRQEMIRLAGIVHRWATRRRQHEVDRQREAMLAQRQREVVFSGDPRSVEDALSYVPFEERVHLEPPKMVPREPDPDYWDRMGAE